MRTISKIAMAVAMTGAVALAAATPSEARDGRNAAAIGGFAAGALVGGAIVGSQNNAYYGNQGYYGQGYYGQRSYGRGYYADPGYAYAPAPAYVDDYAYEPVYTAPRAPMYQGRTYNRTMPCGTGSPSSTNYRPCNNNSAG